MTLEGPLDEFMNVRLASRRASGDVWYLLTAVCVVFGGVYVGKGSLLPFLLLGAITAVVAVRTMPRLALAIGLATIALPYSWSPQIPLRRQLVPRFAKLRQRSHHGRLRLVNGL
jgi:hypothetical protein